MEIRHSADELLGRFKRGSTGILGTVNTNTNESRLRVMYYGVDDDFNCYMMSTKGSPKVEQISMCSSVAFLIFVVEEPYDLSWEIEVNGQAVFLDNDSEIQIALKTMMDRNPFADVALESGITRQFDFFKLIPVTIRFRIYGEALQGNEPTILEFDSNKMP
ncbi:hypothetical protein BVY01_05060 [bacterium I07]|nr:hypothetical protein BVY01_05060 [bacterium I07]